MKKLFLSIVVLFVSSTITFAQETEKTEAYRKWEIGINGGATIFTGEYNMYKEARFNHLNYWNNDICYDYGALAKKNFSHVFAIEAAWNYSNITGSWKYDSRSIRSFKTEVIQTDLNTVWNINNIFSKNRYDRRIYGYAKLGGGISHVWKIEGVTPLYHDQQWKPTIQIGAGVAFHVHKNVKINIGTLWSWVNTDRLDGMKSEDIPTKPGNTEADVYGTKLYTYFGVSYVFGKKKKKSQPIAENPKQVINQDIKPDSNQKVINKAVVQSFESFKPESVVKQSDNATNTVKTKMELVTAANNEDKVLESKKIHIILGSFMSYKNAE